MICLNLAIHKPCSKWHDLFPRLGRGLVKSTTPILFLLLFLLINCDSIHHNPGPTAYDQEVSVDEDSSISITALATHPYDAPLTWILFPSQSHGALAGTLPVNTYTPDPDYNGLDSYSFRVSDGQIDSNVATVTIKINPINDAPTSTSTSITTFEDTNIGVTPTVIDADSDDSFTFSILTQPSSGTVTILADQLFFAPKPNMYGTDSFTYRAFDSGNEYVDGTASVIIDAVNDPPSSTSASITTTKNRTSAGVTPTVIDVDNGDSFTFSILTQPLSGSAYALSNQLYYEPYPDISGSDSFIYRAFDSGAEHVDGTALVTIISVNDPPIAYTQAAIADEDVRLPIVLTASDPDGDELIWTIASQPSNGAVSGTPPNVTYLSAVNYSGSDSFTFKVNDGWVDSLPATVSLTVNPVPDIWFVDIDAAGTADGSSWDNAFNHPQDALDIAGAVDDIWVADGTYVQRSEPDAYVVTMTDGVDLYGGFSGVETALSERDLGTNFTILDGENNARVVYGANNARLDGFTVTRARLNGMLNAGVSPTIAQCIFENNGLVEGSDGGAIHNVSEANARISSSTFTNNYRSAIYNEDSSPTIHNCIFSNNLSDAGGAIKNRGESTAPYIRNSLFEGNSSTANGGAISNVASVPLIENCIFSENSAGQNGGAIANSSGANATVANSLFAGNTAVLSGGAVSNSDSKPTLLNCTVADNYAESFGGGFISENAKGIDPVIINSILWYNSDVQISGKAKVTYSNIQEKLKGKGNIDQEPSFMDTTTGDYRLAPDSPCIDAGQNSSVSTSLDLDGDPRISNDTVDMGAYEYTP